MEMSRSATQAFAALSGDTSQAEFGGSDEYSNRWYAVRWICDALYESEQGDPYRDKKPRTIFPEITSATILPESQSSAVKPEYYSEILRKTSLYSDLVVIVLPERLSGYDTSYSASGWVREENTHIYSPDGKAIVRNHVDGQLERIVELNERYSDLVRARRCVFLPSSLHFTYGTVSEDASYYYTPPLINSETRSPYLPINHPGPDSFFKDSREFFLYKHIILPYFPDIDLTDLVKLRDEETDAFTRFTHFLKLRVGALADTDSVQQIQDVVDEIEYEVAALSVEVEKLSRKRVLDRVHLGTFALSLGALFSSPNPTLAGLAGVVGSVTAFDLVKEWTARKSEKLDLKKSDFYIPYILRESSNDMS